jgi:tricarballylate dehydrogenase
MAKTDADVIVVGAGVAGLCAALSAHDAGARVLVLEAAPEDARGGNSAFAAGAFRFAYGGVDDVLKVIPDLSPEEIENTEFGEYIDKYFDDMDRVTEGRCDPALVEVLVGRSLETAAWMRENGVRFIPNYGSQGYKVGAKTRFRGGSTVVISGGGLGLVAALFGALERKGIDVAYETRADGLIRGAGGIEGVRAWGPSGPREILAPAVVIAAGGFESNPEMRARYLGPGWDLAKVRGTRFNTGAGLRMALDAGAGAAGNWSGCHAVAWDLSAPEFGDINVGVDFKKDSYPYGIVINANGDRFLDEGADIRTFTYAKYGAVILRQPGQFAWQVFDAKVLDLLRDEYHIRQVTRVRADTIEALAAKLHGEALYGVDAGRFLATVKAFNGAVQTDIPFDSNVKDGRGTEGLPIPKSNWANTVDTPPFEAYAVTCGVTFTFGGLRITPGAEVADSAGKPIPGLFACGSSAGGLFYFNYPGGSGLIAGAVFGRIAGAGAAARSSAGAKDAGGT